MSWLPRIFPRDRVQRSLQNLTAVLNAYTMETMQRINETADRDAITLENRKYRIFRGARKDSIDDELEHRLYRSIINDI